MKGLYFDLTITSSGVSSVVANFWNGFLSVLSVETIKTKLTRNLPHDA